MRKNKAASTKHPNSKALVGVITNNQAGPPTSAPRGAWPTGELMDPNNNAHPNQAMCDPDMDPDADTPGM